MQSPTPSIEGSDNDIDMFEGPPLHSVNPVFAQEQIDRADARIHAALLHRRQIPDTAPTYSSFFVKGLQYKLVSTSRFQ